MEQRIYHGNITPQNIATALIARFNRGNLRVTQYGSGDLIALQIASHPGAVSGGPTSASIILKRVEDGVSVQVGTLPTRYGRKFGIHYFSLPA